MADPVASCMVAANPSFTVKCGSVPSQTTLKGLFLDLRADARIRTADPFIRVVRRTSEDPCKSSVAASPDTLEPAVNPLLRGNGRHLVVAPSEVCLTGSVGGAAPHSFRPHATGVSHLDAIVGARLCVDTRHDDRSCVEPDGREGDRDVARGSDGVPHCRSLLDRAGPGRLAAPRCAAAGGTEQTRRKEPSSARPAHRDRDVGLQRMRSRTAAFAHAP
jgi:hypothetical protein